MRQGAHPRELVTWSIPGALLGRPWYRDPLSRWLPRMYQVSLLAVLLRLAHVYMTDVMASFGLVVRKRFTYFCTALWSPCALLCGVRRRARHRF